MTAGTVGALDTTFTAELVKGSATGGWTYVVTDWTAEFFGTPLTQRVDRTPSR